MKRLIFQSHTHQLFGGAESSLLALMSEAINKGYEAHVIVPDEGDFLKAALKAGVITHVIPSYWWTYNERNENEPKLHKKAIEKTRKLLQDLEPLACITNTVTSPWLACAAHNEGFPHIWMLREYGDTDHGLTFWTSKKQLGKLINDLSDKVFTNSPVLKDYYAKLTGRSDIGIITPHVEKPKVVSKNSPFHDASIKLTCVGNLSEGKGQLDAVMATKILKDQGKSVHLILIGLAAQEDYMQRVKNYVHMNNLQDNVTLAGYQKNPADFVSKADINLVCSRSETFGRVTIESLLLGTPVIGTNSANTKSLLDNQNDFLYKFGDSVQLAKKIDYFDKNKNELTKVVEQLKKKVQEKFSPDNAHLEFFNYLEKLPTDRPSNKGQVCSEVMRILDKQRVSDPSSSLVRRLYRKARRDFRRIVLRLKRMRMKF
jgi:glycosyltransferase involved in cell wall biosynthesis